jgi:hypothetical protein
MRNALLRQREKIFAHISRLDKYLQGSPEASQLHLRVNDLLAEHDAFIKIQNEPESAKFESIAEASAATERFEENYYRVLGIARSFLDSKSTIARVTATPSHNLRQDPVITSTSKNIGKFHKSI